MPTVTCLRKTASKRCAIFLDERFWRAVSLEVVMQFGLHKGKDLSASELIELERTSDGHKAFDRALGFIGYRARSVAEVRRRLVRAGFAEEEIEWAIGRLKEFEYLGDEAFAREWIASRGGAKRYGKKRLAAELSKLGVARSVVEAAMSELCTDENEENKAKEAARVLLRRLEGLETAVAQRRLAGHLMRKGFEPSLSREVAKHTLSGQE